MNYMFFLAIIATTLATPAYATVPPITSQDFTAPVEAHWLWTVLASELVVLVAGWVFWRLFERVRDKRYAEAILAIKDAVAACYMEYVRVVKEKDGKLTLEQKNEALQTAYRMAVEFARTRGFDLLKILAKETITALIERFVGEAKAPQPVKAVIGPLVDLPY